MNKNDKVHGGITLPDCENNVNELSDNELNSVAGGANVDLEGWSYKRPQEEWCRNCNAYTLHDIYRKSGALYNNFEICRICGDSWGGTPMIFR